MTNTSLPQKNKGKYSNRFSACLRKLGFGTRDPWRCLPQSPFSYFAELFKIRYREDVPLARLMILTATSFSLGRILTRERGPSFPSCSLSTASGFFEPVPSPKFEWHSSLGCRRLQAASPCRLPQSLVSLRP